MKPTSEAIVERVDDDVTLSVLDNMSRDEKVPPARLIPTRFTKYVPPDGGTK
jgi:hypothetical protein